MLQSPPSRTGKRSLSSAALTASGSVARDRGNPLRVQDFRHRVAHRGIWRHCDAHRIG
jgi:hypothetical protein